MTATLDRLLPSAHRPIARRPLPYVIAILVVLAAAVGLVGFTPLLGVRTVTVRGTHVVTVDQVVSAAAISHGTPLVRLDTGAARARIEKLPDVAKARVSVVYPSSVIITITERVAVGYVEDNGAYRLVDGSGVAFRTIAAVPAGLPHFQLSTGSDSVASGAAASSVAASLPVGVLAEVDVVNTTEPSAIQLALRDGRIVVWGTADRNADKARLLPVLLGQHGSTFDVSNPDVVVVR